jgi:hypothetical protein
MATSFAGGSVKAGVRRAAVVGLFVLITLLLAAMVSMYAEGRRDQFPVLF